MLFKINLIFVFLFILKNISFGCHLGSLDTWSSFGNTGPRLAEGHWSMGIMRQENKSGIGITSGSTTTSTAFPTEITSTSTKCDWATASSFVYKEYQHIAEESAEGNGEHLNALNDILGCPKENRLMFTKFMKHNYNELFKINNDNRFSLLKKLDKLSNNEGLIKCQYFIKS